MQGLDDVDAYTCFISNEASLVDDGTITRAVGETETAGDAENDGENFRAFTHIMRDKLDAETDITGDYYELSTFLPVNGEVIKAGGWNDPAFYDLLDYGHLMGYDFHGPWNTTLTGHQGNIIGEDAHNWGLDLNSAVSFYENGLWDQDDQFGGFPREKIVVGAPGYGYGWMNIVEEPHSEADGSIPSTSWNRLKPRIESGEIEVSHYEVDGQFSAAYGYSAEAEEWWSLDTPDSIALKAEWAVSQGLGGMMLWELANDRDTDLLGATAEVLRAAERGPVPGTEVGTSDPIPWPVPEDNDDVVTPPEDDDDNGDDGELPATGNEPELSVEGNAVIGGEITINGKHFNAGDEVRVELHSTPAVLGTVTADDGGFFSLTATLPDTLEPGTHTLYAIVDGVIVAEYELVVTDALAETGLGLPAGILVLAAGLLGAGALLQKRRSEV